MTLIYKPRSPSFSLNSDNEQPEPTDADDNIVLSDLVRTGEASRLRRRGALRLDHGYAGVQGQPPPNEGSPRMSRSSIIVVEPPTWESESATGTGTGTHDREGAVFARGIERERASRYGRGSPPRGVLGARRGEEDAEEFRYTLFCGAQESEADISNRRWTPYEPSILPLYPQNVASAPPQSGKRAVKSNGCGALLHMHASPRRRLGVWTAKSEASGAVISLDAAYFDRTSVAKIVKSACGCVREGVGCAVW